MAVVQNLCLINKRRLCSRILRGPAMVMPVDHAVRRKGTLLATSPEVLFPDA